jgi:ribonuclease HI
MELMAVISGLEAIKKAGIPVSIYSDSEYVVKAVEEGWLWKWEKKNFAKTKNPDLWQRYIPLHKKYKPKFHWVRGHAGHVENERCDYLAVQAALGPGLLIDKEYEDVNRES